MGGTSVESDRLRLLAAFQLDTDDLKRRGRTARTGLSGRSGGELAADDCSIRHLDPRSKDPSAWRV
jgi:hypothetical protein